MVVGGNVDGGRADDVEIVSPDPLAEPVPDCLSAMNPFPFGQITNGAGAAIAPSKSLSSPCFHLVHVQILYLQYIGNR